MSEAWRLLDLGALEPVTTQTIYETVAHAITKGLVSNTIILCYPASPLVCIGYFQEVEKEVDVECCRQLGLPIVRRVLGGGAVYLDDNQLFYQVVTHEDSPKIPRRIESLYQVLLQAPVETYIELGIPAEYRPINDVQVYGRKISGNGAGKMGKATMLTGNIILDFNYDMMSKVLKVPSEKFKDKIAKSLRDWVTSIKREIGYKPKSEEIKPILVKKFEESLDIRLVQAVLTDYERRLNARLKKKYLSYKWLYMPEYRHAEIAEKRRVKITGDVQIVESMHKSRGGLIRVTMEVVANKINDIKISGDFWLVPTDTIGILEESLLNVELKQDSLLDVVKGFYEDNNVETPGTLPEDFVTSILKGVE